LNDKKAVIEDKTAERNILYLKNEREREREREKETKFKAFLKIASVWFFISCLRPFFIISKACLLNSAPRAANT
jgi:hypothetical protein